MSADESGCELRVIRLTPDSKAAYAFGSLAGDMRKYRLAKVELDRKALFFTEEINRCPEPVWDAYLACRARLLEALWDVLQVQRVMNS